MTYGCDYLRDPRTLKRCGAVATYRLDLQPAAGQWLACTDHALALVNVITVGQNKPLTITLTGEGIKLTGIMAADGVRDAEIVDEPECPIPDRPYRCWASRVLGPSDGFRGETVRCDLGAGPHTMHEGTVPSPENNTQPMRWAW